MRSPPLQVTVEVDDARRITAFLDGPSDGRGLILAHGAGGSAASPFLERLAAGLARRGFLVVRFNFPFSEERRRAPDRAAVLLATWRAVIDRFGSDDVLVGGKSMGGRYATMALAADDPPPAAAIVLFGYPLHPPGRPDQRRTAHLPAVGTPMLFLSGTRDPLARIDLLSEAVGPLEGAVLEVIEGADHDFRVRGRSPEEVIEELCDRTLSFALERADD